MTKREALRIIGGFSSPGKMDCPGFGLQAKMTCPTGAMLCKIDGSVCSKCYACRGRYVFSTVIAAQVRRKCAIELALSNSNLYSQYLEAWKVALNGVEYFRFHDSGDVFSEEYGDLLIAIVGENPNTKFWIPTKQKAFAWKCYHINHHNLIVRLSAPMINEAGDRFVYSSSVVTQPTVQNSDSFMCPATMKEVKNCTECGRMCWDKRIQTVCYLQH